MSDKAGFILTSALSMTVAGALFNSDEMKLISRMAIAFAIAFLNQIPWNRLKSPRPSWERTLAESFITGFIAAGIVGIGLEQFPSINIGVITFVGVLIGGMGTTAFGFLQSIGSRVGLKNDKEGSNDKGPS